MEDELDTYTVPYPCWVIVSDDSVIHEADGSIDFADRVGFIGLTDGDGQRYVGVFTDRDLAQRFADAAKMNGVGFGSVENNEKMVDVLKSAADQFGHVAFDPASPTSIAKHTWPIDYVIEHLERDDDL